MTKPIPATWAALVVVAVVASSLAAQQPGRGAGQGRQGGQAAPGGRQGGVGGAPPAINWPSPDLPDGPIVAQSAVPAHRDLRIMVTKGLSHPWAMAFLPDGGILVTERAGRLRIIRNGVLDPTPIAGVPAVDGGFLNGLLDVALHPQYAKNRWVYFTYHKPLGAPAAAPATPPAAGARAGGGGRGGGGGFELVLGRGTFDGKALTDVREVFNTHQQGSASRIVFARDGTIYMSSGNASEVPDAPPQDPNDYRGKVLRIRDDGSVPPDNPFVGRAGYKPEIFSLGHRTQLGMALNPETGELWASEQGPNGGDEINIIRAGKNYGWPVVSYGRSYPGPRLGLSRPDMEEPIVIWIPSIAVSGLSFYTGDVFAGWKRSAFVGGMRQGEVPRTGQIQRIEFNEKWEEIRREPMLRELQQRIRDVRPGPDGYLYALTEEDNAALLRIEPAAAK
jgi:aldose sugar dehydrogenase